jgi:hypothetical protein
MMLALRRHARHVRAMLNILSILIGLLVLLCTLIGFIPFLGWLNWLTIPLGIVGLALGALSAHKMGRNLNLVLIIVCAIRLFLGGGII